MWARLGLLKRISLMSVTFSRTSLDVSRLCSRRLMTESVRVSPWWKMIRTGSGNRVIVARGEGRFQAVEVKPGLDSGEFIEVLEGLEEARQRCRCGENDSDRAIQGGLPSGSISEIRATAKPSTNMSQCTREILTL